MDKKLIVIIVLFGILCFIAGTVYGADKTTDWMLNILWGLMEKEKINIDVDKEMFKNGILQYKNEIGGCLFIEDAPLSSN